MSTSTAELNDLGLPALTSEQAPLFTDLAGCKKWLSGIAITNATQAQAQLLRQLDWLNRYALPPEERLLIVEYLRSPIYFVHGECCKRFIAKPLPLAQPEQAAFDAGQALWLALETGYLHCLQGLLDQAASRPYGDDARQRAALAATRALTTALCRYLDHCNAGFIVGTDFWGRLHRIYFAAERLGATQQTVADKLTHATSVTAQATYVETLLLAAALPHQLRPRQFANVVYWAHRWATKVPLLTVPPEDLRTAPLCVDLASARPGEYSSPRAAAALRWLDLGELRKTIKQRLVKLGQGVSPQELKLGKDCTQPSCELLLRQVYHDWCKGGRSAPPASGKTYQVAGNIDALHYHLSGRLFSPPQQSLYLSKREADEIATFGHIATRFEENKKLQDSYCVEEWQTRGENVVDVELQRPLDHAGNQLASDRLVGLRPAGQDGAAFQLGKITRSSVDLAQGTLRASIHLLPGAASAVTLCNPASGATKAQYSRGFCLPAIEGLNQVATVLLPPAWFRAGHVVELIAGTGTTQRVRLTKVIERGADFERCAYEAL